MSSEEDREEEFDESGMYLDKESIQLICNALHEYKPTEDEKHLLSVLLEEFEEILVVDYKEPYPDIRSWTALFFRGLVGYYMTFSERCISFNLCLREIFSRGIYNRLRDKRSVLDCIMT